ncbi:MAG: polysaccharide deacetylase family protein, partial [Candidatus Heimdallarchaeota archaeon]|nr:polysaccharide deacetylase family protein [Candidatus Heimdallarchaeota archaeon]
EIVEGKKSLENMINDQVKLFAYPNGKPNKDYTSTHIEMLKKAGFKAAVTTEWGCTKKQNLDNYQLSRFTPWDKNNRKFGMRLMLNCLKC